MQNAHERFGTLEFTKRMKDTTTRVRVYIDRAILEEARDDRGPIGCHLLSMVGGDAEIGALSAAVTEGALFSDSPSGQRIYGCFSWVRGSMLSRECGGFRQEASSATSCRRI